MKNIYLQLRTGLFFLLYIHIAMTEKSELIPIRVEKFSVNEYNDGDSFVKGQLANSVNGIINM